MKPSARTLTDHFFGDFFGAFADTAVLFPIITLLGIQAGFSLPILLVSSGALYLAAGFLFRSPMPVQPLKSVALSALALGAGKSEILTATLFIGGFFVLLLVCNRRLLRLPEEAIRCVQAGLGVLLILQGLGSPQVLSSPQGSFAGSVLPALLLTLLPILLPILLLASALLFLDKKSRWPWLGIFAFLAFLTSGDAEPPPSPPGPELFRWSVIASLVLPQLALTSANSILGTELAYREYFPDQTAKHLRSRLLLSIGAGNLLMGLIGGLPFCHGSGGLTAHYRAGARTWLMNGVIGTLLIWLGFRASQGAPPGALPPIPCAAILITVGVHHLGLARSLLGNPVGKRLLLAATLLTLLSKNLLFTLLAALLILRLPLPGRARGAPA